MSKFTPRPYQELIINSVMANERIAVLASMGSGKTVSTLTAIARLQALEGAGPALILAPLRVARSTWPQEVMKWEHLKHLKVSVICGTKTERLKALSEKSDIYITNYETLPWLNDNLVGAWPFDIIVADESTRLKGFRTRQGGQRSKALAIHAHKSRRFIELTGTPAPNGLQDLWGQMWFIDKGQRLGRSFSAYMERWFEPKRVTSDPHAIKWEPRPSSQDQIQSAIKDVCVSINAADYFDLQKPIETVIRVDLPPKAMEQYKAMEKEMFLDLGDTEVEAFNAASKTTKCLQLANGAIYTDGTGGFKEIHNEKIEALKSIVEEAAGMPVLVAYQFKSDLARLLKAFPKGRTLDKKPKTIAQWNKGEIPVLFAHPASAGHGLNLQDGGNIIAIFGHWWNLEEREQIIERIGPTRQKQAGYDRPVYIYDIVAKDTVDEIVLKRVKTKASVQDLLLEAMKQKRNANGRK